MIQSPTYNEAAKYWFSAVLIYLSVLFIYRLGFHPLRAYPGPLFAKLTDAYGGIQALMRSSHLAAHENHLKYGPVFRQGPNRLVFNTLTALQEIYLNPKVNKSHLYLHARVNPKGSVFEMLDVHQHRERRKIISQPIKDQAMRRFEPILTAQLTTFLQILSTSAHAFEPINMTENCRNLAGDVIGHLAFGYHLNLQKEADNRWLLWGFSLTSARINVYMQFPLVARMEGVLRFLIQSLRKRYHRILQRMIKARTSKSKDAHPDLYSYAADALGGDPTAKESALWAEATFFIIAGAGTVTTAMSALFFYLSHYPESYARLANEIRTTFTSLDDIKSGEKLRNCEYLRACINEALRMSSPNTSVLWRESSASVGSAPLVVDGLAIPPGTQIGINLYALHHNELYFPDSFKFKPDRWLTAEAKEANSTMQKAFAPFSVGPHACAGRALAYLETSLTIAKTIFAFDFRTAPGKPG